MKSHLLKNHSALLKKSKAASHGSRRILDRISSLETKGIITSAKGEYFRKILHEKNYSPIYIQKIDKELDRILSEKNSEEDNNNNNNNDTDTNSLREGSCNASNEPSEKSLPDSTDTRDESLNSLPSPTELSQSQSEHSEKTSSTTSHQWQSLLQSRNSGDGSRKANVFPSWNNNHNNRHISWEDRSESTGRSTSYTLSGPTITLSSSSSKDQDDLKPTFSEDSSKATVRSTATERTNGKRQIMDWSEMNVHTYNKPFNENEQKQLFVEMCFFARLGFVQPPCCMKCARRESLDESAEPWMDCPRWVVWRKDANLMLHPAQLENNIAVIQCQAVRQLLQGEVVEGYFWNAEDSVLEKEESDNDDDDTGTIPDDEE